LKKIEKNLFIKCNNIYGCKKYIKQYPHGRFIKEVNKKLEKLFYKKAVKHVNQEIYLKEYPNGQYKEKILNQFIFKSFQYKDRDSKLVSFAIDPRNEDIVLAGYYEGVFGAANMYIIKMDKNGKIIWKKIISTKGYRSIPSNIVITKTGNIVIGGRQNGYFSVMLDSYGNIKWQYNQSGYISFVNMDNKLYINQDNEGNIIGISSSYEEGIVFLKLNKKTGHEMIKRLIKLNNHFLSIMSVFYQKNKIYVLTSYDDWNDIIELNYNGEKIDTIRSIGTHITIDQYNNFYIIDTDKNGSYIKKINSKHKEIWKKYYKGRFSYAITVDIKNNIIVSGEVSGKLWIAKINNKDGSILGERVFESNENFYQWSNEIITMKDNVFLLGGNMKNKKTGGHKIFFIKLLEMSL
jgi:hypothetical protein